MSRHKNPLKDLDLFLRQQATTLATPTPLSERISTETGGQEESTHGGDLVQQLTKLAETDRQQFLDAVIAAAAASKFPENTLLINTALYLKHPDNWKEAVMSYWKNKH
jgi:outer membrane cobalamin receptor